MDKRWRNLVFAIAVAGILGIAFLLLSQGPGFNERLSVMRKTWQSYGIEEPLHLSYQKLNSLDGDELAALRKSLLRFNEEEKNPATRELSDAYVSLVDICIYRKKMLEKQEELNSVSDPCAHLSEFDELTLYKERLLASTRDYAEKVDSFISDNPSKAKLLELQSAGSVQELEQKLAEHKKLIAELKGVCR